MFNYAAYQKKQSKSTKRKTRQAKALENAKKAPRTFLELLQEVRANDTGGCSPSASKCYQILVAATSIINSN